ncbi:MAG: putative zinc-binding metallopeptidase [Bacteroidales bacterium]|nr:putative zinc-binding metallopeptidase [Bacteroides sp.]MCM1197467.1 putative zinc-binding metallopeptidase [Clostridium sp.]MCM1502266.1 putative zinc-binding metallopeptidase [Bacteroidales bacterium]
MNRYLKYFIVMLVAAALASCAEKPLDPQSQIIDSQSQKNEFDRWIIRNYVEPYNIDFKYRMERNESDMNYWLVPAEYDKSIQMAKLMLYLCIEPYDEITGSKEFIRSYYPKMIHLIGSAAYNNNKTMVLGTAEGGLKITMYYVNNIMLDPDYLNHYYFKTMHHEFTHILNQTKPYSTDFDMISGADYVTDSWSDAWEGSTLEAQDASAQKAGFISTYASKEAGEDFAELLSLYVTNTEEYWNGVLANAGAGADKIRAKFDIVYNYMINSWDIDLDELRDIIHGRQDRIGELDLENL